LLTKIGYGVIEIAFWISKLSEMKDGKGKELEERV
jgi:hypothetical protein